MSEWLVAFDDGLTQRKRCVYALWECPSASVGDLGRPHPERGVCVVCPV